MLSDTNTPVLPTPPLYRGKQLVQATVIKSRFTIGSSDAIIPAVDGDGTFLAELLFRFMYLSDEVYKPFSRLGNALFWPVGELELSDSPRPVVDRVRHLELSKYVLRHVVLRDGFDDERVVPDRSLGRPILITFFLWQN